MCVCVCVCVFVYALSDFLSQSVEINIFCKVFNAVVNKADLKIKI